MQDFASPSQPPDVVPARRDLRSYGSMSSAALVAALSRNDRGEESTLCTLAESLRRLPFGVHLAVMRQPYLDYILSGAKTVESRLTKRRVPPFGCVDRGDVVLFKLAGGPVVAAAAVESVHYAASPGDVRTLLSTHRESLQLHADWEAAKRDAAFGTFMHLVGVTELERFSVEKRDRRAWIPLTTPAQTGTFPL